METIKYYLNEKTKLLKKNFVSLPRLEARLLLSKILNKSLNWTYLNLEKKITKKQFENYEKIIKKKIKRFPTAYLLENKEFYSLNPELFVKSDSVIFDVKGIFPEKKYLRL